MKIHYTLLLSIISISLLIPAFGHGTGIESSLFVKVDDRDIRLTVEHLMLDSDESTKKFFQIHAYDRTNKITIENINFDIALYNDNKLILDDSFFEQEGLLVLDLNTDKNGIFTFNVINEEKIEEIKKIRDKAIILVGFGGGFRRTELISIDHEDLEFVTEGVKITIKRSKTDQLGEGMTKGLPYFANETYCPVSHLKKWIEISNIKDGAIFRRFVKGSSLTSSRLTDQSVVLLIKRYLELAGIENKNYSGHSLRSGFATVSAESGADERSIMAMTGHKTTQMVRRYIKEANLFKNNALNKIKI